MASSERRPQRGQRENWNLRVAPQWRQAGLCFTTPVTAAESTVSASARPSRERAEAGPLLLVARGDVALADDAAVLEFEDHVGHHGAAAGKLAGDGRRGAVAVGDAVLHGRLHPR